MSIKNNYNILLVEDNKADVKLFSSYISQIKDFTTKYDVVNTLQESYDLLEKNNYDIITLDLNLPDSKGFDTVIEFCKQGYDIPVIILTSIYDSDYAVMALQLGIQDYILKEELTSSVLSKTIRYAITRYKLIKKEEELELKERQLIDYKTFDRIINQKITSNKTEKALGMGLLSERDKNQYQKLKEKSIRILDLVIEERLYQVDHMILDKIKDLSEEIGYNLGSAKDILQLSKETLANVVAKNKKKAKLYIQENKYYVIQLMGFLINFYRKYSIDIIPFIMEGKEGDSINDKI